MSSNNQIILFKQFNFLLELDGVISAGFTEVNGLEYESNVAEYREGYDSERVRKISGLTKFNNITLKRGVVSLANMGDWFRSTKDGQIVRRDGTIILLDESKKEVLRWTFMNGWICKCSAPKIQSLSNEVDVELMEICHEGLSLKE